VRRPSPLALRLLAVHVLVLFLPVTGIWSLAAFEKSMLAAEERGMIAQARALAAGLERTGPLDGTSARALLAAVQRPLGSRVRVVDREGGTLADSASVEGTRRAGEPELSPTRRSWLYRLGAGLVDLGRRTGLVRRAGGNADRSAPGGIEPEIGAALAGRYGAAARTSEDGAALVLSSAVPVRAGDRVEGAVIVSRTTAGVLAALDEVRVDLFRIVLVSLAAASLLAFLLARNLVTPLARLSAAATTPRDGRSGAATPFPGMERRDEIGELARSLTRMRNRLDARMSQLESFAAEVSHELANPLAGVRSAGELLGEVEDEGQRERLAGIVAREVKRMEAIVSGLHDLAAADAEPRAPDARWTDLAEIARGVAEGVEVRGAKPVEIQVAVEGDGPKVLVPPERVAQVIGNLVDNAVDFSPPGGRVEVRVGREGGRAVLEVLDAGRGIPEANRERIFERFFSDRPETTGDRHLGLGLNLVRTIAERYGGRVEFTNRAAGGARFRVEWPLAGRAGDRG